MGNTQNKTFQEQVLNSPHSRLSNAKVISDKDTIFIQTIFKVQNKQFDEWQTKLENGSNKPSSKYLLLPQKINFKHDEGLCGNSGSLTVNYPYHPYLLSQLIKQRQIDNKLFKQSQLWYVLFALIQAKHDISPFSKQLGDVKPANVFLNQDGKAKIVNCFSWPNQENNFIKAFDADKKQFDGFLAPEDLRLLAHKAIDNQINQQSDIFAIGATVLSAGILDTLSSLYDYSSSVFNIQKLKQKRKIWAQTQKYSGIFKSLILNLTEPNPKQRLTANQLWEWINQYQKNILEKNRFVIEVVPSKIQKAFVALQNKIY